MSDYTGIKLSYTAHDQDVVIWKGKDFVSNVGASILEPMGVERMAFDAEVSDAQEIVKRWNAHEELLEALEFAAKSLLEIGKDSSIPAWAKVKAAISNVKAKS